MIYIGIPVRNERHTIGPLLWRIRQLLAPQGRGFQVLVVDDASTDGTAETVERYTRVLPLALLRHDEPRGYAASLERLVREAVSRSGYPKRDALVTLQADFTDPPEAIPEMIRRFEGGMDLVMASDADGEDEVDGDVPAPPRAVRWARIGARWLARSLPRPPEVEDPYGSFRLYRLFTLARALSDVPAGTDRFLTQEDWGANAELLLAVWPHARRSDRVHAPRDYGRRYRETRLRPLSRVWSLRKAAGSDRMRSLADRMARAADG